jgi:hypothetical protein
VKIKLAAVLAVLAVVGLAACGPTGSAAPSSGAHMSCAHDADAAQGDPDGDCS